MGRPGASQVIVAMPSAAVLPRGLDATGTVIILGPGEGAGEAALLEPGVHTATGRALTDLEFLRLGGELVMEDLSAGLPDVPTNAVIVDPLNPEFLYVGNDLGVFVSTDNGENWTLVPSTDPGNPTSFDSPFDFIVQVAISPTTGRSCTRCSAFSGR